MKWDERGPFQQVSNGHVVHILDPRPEEIYIEDIAISLARQPRYLGHTRPELPIMSIAQHSVDVASMMPGNDPDLELYALLHDAEEYVMGDTTSPMKEALEVVAPGALGKIANGLKQAIAHRFELPWPMPRYVKEQIKQADLILMATEKRDLLVASEKPWVGILPEPMPKRLELWSEKQALNVFIACFAAIQRFRGASVRDVIFDRGAA